MSHRLTGKIPSKIKCGIDIMRSALIDIIPEWEKYLKNADGKNKFKARVNEYTDEDYDIVIPNSDEFLKKAGHYGDVGFRKESDGSWTIHHNYFSSDYGRDAKDKLADKMKELPALDHNSEWYKKVYGTSRSEMGKFEHLIAVSIYTVIMKRFAQRLNQLGFEDVSMQKIPGRTLVGGTIDADKVQGMRI